MNIIAADGLLLEPQVADHAAEMFTVLSDPAIYEHEGEPPASVEWLRERFARLESRRSPDGREQWLNWVIRLPSGRLAGYVQATVHPGGRADVAYVLSSRYWGVGLAQRAVKAMVGELTSQYRVMDLRAVLKGSNARSLRLLERLGFEPVPPPVQAEEGVDADESMMRLLP